jgi:hypothetical protein
MGNKFRVISKVFLSVAAVAYPVMVFYFLVIRKTPIRMLSLFVIAFAVFAFIAGTSTGSTAGTTDGTAKKKVTEASAPTCGLPSSFSAQGLCAC